MAAQEWEDKTGRVRWQPRLESRSLLWVYGVFFLEWGHHQPREFHPALYRSKRRAERIAAREERRRRRMFEPAS